MTCLALGRVTPIPPVCRHGREVRFKEPPGIRRRGLTSPNAVLGQISIGRLHAGVFSAPMAPFSIDNHRYGSRYCVRRM